MDKVIRTYSTFFIMEMDQRTMNTFVLPPYLEPAENAAVFNKICFLFLLPHDPIWTVSEARLSAALRRQLYRHGPH